MKDFKSIKVVLITLSICAVLLSGGWYFYVKKQSISPILHKSDQFVQERAALERLLQNSSEIHRLWNEGEDSREWALYKKQCLSYFKIEQPLDESFLRCNPILIQCNHLFNKKLNYRFIETNLDQNHSILYRYLTKSNTSYQGLDRPGYLFVIEDLLTHKKLNLFLEDQCQEVFLQNRIYAYGEEIMSKPHEEIEDYRFDNFNQNVYIDRHLVLNQDINDWIDFGDSQVTVGLKKTNTSQLLLPATNLTLIQMQNFCSFKGKQVLTAHYFDAATFLPMDLNDITPKKNSRSPYYWTKKKSVELNDCSLLFAEECLANKSNLKNSSSPSWAGILNPMGGVLEAFRNPIDPESNLKASSYYFNFKSSWHKLGFRAGWDGEGFDLRHFDFKGINPSVAVDKFNIGFRCMRESK